MSFSVDNKERKQGERESLREKKQVFKVRQGKDNIKDMERKKRSERE